MSTEQPEWTRAERAIAPDVETPLTFTTMPAAACLLRHGDTEILRLHADDTGAVTFHARGPAGAEPLELRLDSTAPDGTQHGHTIVLAAAPGAPTAADATTRPKPAGTTVSPLDAGSLQIENHGLVQRGYPPRPPRARATAYARWVENVSRPWTRVGSRIAERPDVRFGAATALRSPTLPLPPPRASVTFNNTSDTWSGAQFSHPEEQFMYVDGTWTVPGVLPVIVPGYSATAAWAGLTADKLYQAGSDSESYNLQLPFGGTWQFTNYWMWLEAYPWPSWQIPNMPISPGDEVQVIIFPAQADGNTVFARGTGGGLTAADNNVWYMIYNHTRGTSFWGSYECPFFTGTNVEWIVERPEVNGSSAPLAFFLPFSMWSLWYGDSEMGWSELFPSGSGIWGQVPTYMNMQDAASGHLLDIVHPQPDRTGDGGQEMVFIWTNSQ
jgi:hypothetical protein